MSEGKRIPEARERETESKPGETAQVRAQSRPAYGQDSLKGQAAIVTGASSGIGEAVALELAARGASVVVDYHGGPEPSQKIISRIQAQGGVAAAVPADVSQPEEINRLVQECVRQFGRLDIMVANAGVQVDATALEMTPQQWDKALSVDLRGLFLCAQAAARIFVKQGVDARISRAAGKILCMLSVHDRVPWMGHVNYATAKAGAHMMMQTLAQEWARYRIRVTGISPGAIKTAINKSVWGDPESREALLKLIPYGRMGETQDIANAAAWLVSDEADYITGTTLYVDGGMMQYPGFMGNG
jgi:glucose 1-dehydrogenase